MCGEKENERALAVIEEGKLLHLRPTTDEIMPMTTRRAKGYMQRSQVIGRTSTGEVFTKTIDIRTDKVVSRLNAMTKARNLVENVSAEVGGGTGSIPTAVIATLYRGTYQLNPA